MAKVHVTLNQKGGVGKTTITVNLAAVCATALAPDPSGNPQVLVVSIDPTNKAVEWAKRLRAHNIPFQFVQATDDIAELSQLDQLPVKHVFVDTPAWGTISPKPGANPLGTDDRAAAIRAVLSCAHDVIVPMEPEGMSFDETALTVDGVLRPMGIPYAVVVNNWDPRDGDSDRDATIQVIEDNGWERANTVIRHYKIHAKGIANGEVCTQYTPSGMALRGQLDFWRLALELGLGGKAAELADRVHARIATALEEDV